MSRWFRAYDDALDDPKVQNLPAELFKAWFNLLCVSSKNQGKNFGLDEVVFRLRIAPSKAKKIMAELCLRGLVDELNGCYISHNWQSRQYKSDTSKERVARYRERQCNVTSPLPVTAPENTEQNRTEEGEDARARTPEKPSSGVPRALIRPEATEIATEIAVLCGHPSPMDWPPGFCGAAYTVETWLAGGWSRPAIIAGVQEALARKRDGPPDSVSYFAKPIARVVARNSAPLPKFEATQQDCHHGRQQENSVSAAAKRLVERMRQFDEPRATGGGEGRVDVRLLPQG